MLSLPQIEADLIVAMKAKDQLAVDTLRGLKVRVQNDQIAKMSAKGGSASGGKDLSQDEMVALVKSEIKRRKEAAESFTGGGRPDQAQKELDEAKVLEKYLPAQLSEQEIIRLVDEAILQTAATAKDFGKVMGQLKAKVGQQADGAVLAKILKEKLK